LGLLLNIMTLRFTIEGSADGGYIGTCSELGARLEARNLAALEGMMSAFARAFVEDWETAPPFVLIRRSFPGRRALA
jgi:hypothetical protein